VARALGVGTIVAGSVASSGDRLRVSVRLVDPVSGVQLLARTQERTPGDFFALQDEITRDVSDALRVRLGVELEQRQRRATTTNLDAWELVQRAERIRDDARGLATQREHGAAGDAYGRAEQLLMRAATADPRWDVPLLALGELDIDRYWETVEADEPDLGQHWLRRGLEHTQRALALRPADPRAQELDGFLRYLLWVNGYAPSDTTRTTAERQLRGAVATDPTRARAWYGLSEIYRYTGRFIEADQAAKNALDADAYLRQAHEIAATLFFNALNQERFPEARQWCRYGTARFARNPNFIDCELRLLGWSGRGDEAVASAWAILAALQQRDPAPRHTTAAADRRLMVAAVLARSGLKDSALSMVASTRRTLPDSIWRSDNIYTEAYVRLLLGDRDEAIRLLTVYLAANPHLRGYVARSAWFRPLVRDRRFQDLVRGNR
jgi:tetratricopeptide (TPR) repeat protein